MKVLDLLINGSIRKQYIIGQAKEFSEIEPTMRIIDPNFKGVVDYETYSDRGDESTGIPVIIPKTYHFESISYSPTLTMEERKDRLIDEIVSDGFEVKTLKWEDIN